MAHTSTLLLASLLHLSCLSSAHAVSDPGDVTTPEEHLGRPVGGDFTLADWPEVSSYFHKLDGESARVETVKVGESTEGRDFLLSIISSPRNLKDLDAIRENARLLADPRGASEERLEEAVREGKVVLFISCAMHATECASPQFAMEFAHLLATSENELWQRVREDVVILLAPTLNPDGLDHVTSWYRENVGTPYEGAGLLKLYQYYSGHDNNRDWFMLTQAETQIVTELLYKVWHPQIYWDVHQQGSTKERLFVPPFRDPLNPNLDPSIITGIDILGTRALFDLTRAGFTGVSSGVSYDMWWNGGNRNVPVRHNIIGLLTEAASAKLASPIFLEKSKLSAPGDLDHYAPSNRFPNPWPGGWWRIRDIIDYELAFADSLLASAARERELWLSNALEASKRALKEGAEEPPLAWVLPSTNRDPFAVERLTDTLIRGGVEVHVAEAEVSADGRSWPAGSIVILREQPYGAHVKDLFEVQRYPEGKAPYDVAGWTLPILLGVHRVELMTLPEGELREVATAADAVAGFAGDPRATEGAIASADSGAWSEILRLDKEAAGRSFVTSGERAGLVVSDARDGEESVTLSSGSRVGVYSPWRGSMDEGWMRYVLDTFGVEYRSVKNEMLRAGSIDDFLDVLVIPSISGGQLDDGRSPGSVAPRYTLGLDPEGAVAVEEFVREGGTLITVGSSSQWAIDLFELPLVDVTRGDDAGEFSCPGSLLRTIPEESPITAGLPSSIGVFFSRSSAWRAMTAGEREEARRGEAELSTLLSYAPSRLLLSGYCKEPETIEGRAAWVQASHGEGEVHLFGFRPQYRGWSQATFPLLFRAILFAGN